MISQLTIDKVFEAARVEEVIGDYIQLKKSGSGYKGLSPFTNEKTPSFHVSPSKQIWKDFSSGKGGNVVAFLMEHERFTYPEAIRHLARRYGIEIEETERTDEEKESLKEKENLYVVSEAACSFFESILWEDEHGRAIGWSYFRERGFNDQIIKDFRLGYSPEQRDAFSNFAVGKGYSSENLIKAGLCLESQTMPVGSGSLVDRFRGRVMFPIFSMSGRVLGFGGRILTSDKKLAKYINSPESEIYHKSHVLYGLYQAKQEIARLDNCFLVEGYTDVIQMHQLGIKNVVASSGTALTSEQVSLIRRLTRNVTLLFDGDAAGLRAAERGVDLILEQDMNAWVCTFPDGEDPDSFARRHTREEVVEFLEGRRKDFIFFKADIGSEEFDRNPIRRAETARELVRSIACIPDMIRREVYIRESAAIMGVSEEALFAELSQLDLARKRREELQSRRRDERQSQRSEEVPVMEPVRNEPQTGDVLVPYEVHEKRILEVLVSYGHLIGEFQEWVEVPDENGNWKVEFETATMPVYERIDLDLSEDGLVFTRPIYRELYERLITAFRKEGTLNIAAIQADLSVEVAEELARIAMEDERYPLDDWERKEIYPKPKEQQAVQLVSETLLSLKMDLVKTRIRELQQSLEAPDADHLTLLREITDYNKLKIMIHKRLNRIMS